MKKMFTVPMLLLLLLTLVACGEAKEEVGTNEGSSEETVGNEEAAEWPTKQVRYIVPNAPGGLSDITARVLERIIRENDMLNESFTVTNIEGASAGNGMNEVRNADPDGHMLLHHHSSFIAHKLTGVRDWGFEAFTPVVQLFEVPFIIYTHPDSYDTIEEFVEDVKNNPGERSQGGSTTGGMSYTESMVILNELGIKDDLNFVSHGGGGPMVAALLGGENDIAVGALPEVIDYHRSGDLKILAVGSEERFEALPEVPTFDEVGIDLDALLGQTMGVWAPPETPVEIVDEMYDVFAEIVQSEEFIEAGNQHGFIPRLADADSLYQLFEEKEEKMVKILEWLNQN